MGIALGSIIIGAGTGGALMCLLMFGSYWMVRGPQGAFATIAMVAFAGGLISAGIVGGAVSRALGSPLRRIMVAMIAVAGAAFVGVLTTIADMLGGRMGLAVLGTLCLAGILGARRLVAGPA